MRIYLKIWVLELEEARGYADLFFVPKGETLVLLPLSKTSDGILKYIFNLLAIETNRKKCYSNSRRTRK